MIVDAHLHVWRSDPTYPDQTGTTLSPACDVPLSLLEQYMQEHSVDRAVLVQPVYPGENNDYVAKCARANPDRFAAVCVIDPRTEQAGDKLRHWVEERGCRGLRLRPRVPAEAECFGDRSTYPLWETIRAANVVVNVLGNTEHLPAVDELATAFPEVTIIIDHLAHPPNTRPEACQPLLGLARHANVMLKISGFPYYSKTGYPYDDCRDLIQAIHQRFGATRMIWGSDFPHILLQSGYRRALTWLERHCPFLTTSELDQVMGGTAGGLYFR